MPGMGAVSAGVHEFPVRVYYEDTDAGGIVYHAAYLHFAERARTEFLRCIGWPHERLQRETGFFWAVRRAEIDYRQPARLDDALIVASRVLSVRGASVIAEQIVRRAGLDLALLTLQLVLLNGAGRPAKPPPTLRQSLTSLLTAQEGTSDPCKSIP
jgi:acyl-CoA thioester hydrolase